MGTEIKTEEEILKEEFDTNVLEMKKASDRMKSLKAQFECYHPTPQIGCELKEKEKIWREMMRRSSVSLEMREWRLIDM